MISWAFYIIRSSSLSSFHSNSARLYRIFSRRSNKSTIMSSQTCTDSELPNSQSSTHDESGPSLHGSLRSSLRDPQKSGKAGSLGPSTQKTAKINENRNEVRWYDVQTPLASDDECVSSPSDTGTRRTRVLMAGRA